MRRIKTMGAFGIALAVILGLALGARAQEADYGGDVLPLAAHGTWTFTGSLHHAREEHTATRLANGKVLVTGGAADGLAVNSSELYNPATGTWTGTGNLNVGRADAGAVLLNTGNVLVAGGCIGTCLAATPKAELYNPTTGTWTLTGNLATARAFFTLTKLANGLVLAAGGCSAFDVNGCTVVTNLAEIYNPSTGAWTPTKNAMRAGRATHTATLLTNGTVLVAGGANAAGDALGSSELFTPTTGWTLTGKMNSAHAEHTAALLTNGKVLVAGGENVSGVSQNTAEIYDPSTFKWTLTGHLNTARQDHTAVVLLTTGKVLVAGGSRVTATNVFVLASAELFNPGTGLWSTTGSMKSVRTGHTATLLTSGLVLAAAGSDPVNELISAEFYTP